MDHLSVMTELVSLLLALVRSNKQLQAVLEQQLPGDVGAEVAASSPECVWAAAILGFRVTPQNVHYLQEIQAQNKS